MYVVNDSSALQLGILSRPKVPLRVNPLSGAPDGAKKTIDVSQAILLPTIVACCISGPRVVSGGYRFEGIISALIVVSGS